MNSKKINHSFLKKIPKEYLLVTIFPIILWIIIFALANVGLGYDVSMVFSDAFNQYLPFHAEFKEILVSHDWSRFFYDWNLGLGSSFIGVFGYYLSSPFTLLSLFFKTEHLPSFFYLVVLLKVGLAGLFCFIFLKAQSKVTYSNACLFSILYACMGTLIDRFFNFMWLDAIFLLPLVILTLQRLIHEKKWKGFFFSLIYLFWSNFYMAYMVGIFCFIWFMMEWFFSNEKKSKEWRKCFRLFLLCPILAALICSPILLPTYIALKESSYGQNDMSFYLYPTKNFLQFFSDFYIGSYNGLGEESNPSFYVTLLGFFISCSYFFNPLFERKRKIGYGCLIVFFFISFNTPALDIAWHAFKAPKGFPNRYSFLLSFLLIYLGCLSLSSIKRLLPKERYSFLNKTTCMALGFTLFYMILTFFGLFDNNLIMDGSIMIINFVILSIYVIILRGILKNVLNTKSVWNVWLWVIVSLEIILNGSMSVTQLKGMQYSWRHENTETHLAIKNAIEEVENQPFERFYFYGQGINPSLLYQRPTIENYNTLGHRQINGFYSMLLYGIDDKGITSQNSFFKTSPMMFFDSLFGLKYYYAPSLSLDESGCLEWLKTLNEHWLVNPYALPLAFSVDPLVLMSNEETEWTTVGLKNQEILLNQLLGHERNSEGYVSYVSPLKEEVVETINLKIEDVSGYYKKEDLNEESWLVLKISLPRPLKEENQENASLYLNLFTNTTHEIYLNDSYLTTTHEQFVFDLETIEEVIGEETSFYLSLKMDVKDDGRLSQIKLSLVDEQQLIDLVKQLGQEQRIIPQNQTNPLSFSVNLEEDNFFWFSIPYNSHWKATIIDTGEEVEVFPIKDCFIGMFLSKGNYEISLNYELIEWKWSFFLFGVGIITSIIFLIKKED